MSILPRDSAPPVGHDAVRVYSLSTWPATPMIMHASDILIISVSYKHEMTHGGLHDGGLRKKAEITSLSKYFRSPLRHTSVQPLMHTTTMKCVLRGFSEPGCVEETKCMEHARAHRQVVGRPAELTNYCETKRRILLTSQLCSRQSLHKRQEVANERAAGKCPLN